MVNPKAQKYKVVVTFKGVKTTFERGIDFDYAHYLASSRNKAESVLRSTGNIDSAIASGWPHSGPTYSAVVDKGESDQPEQDNRRPLIETLGEFLSGLKTPTKRQVQTTSTLVAFLHIIYKLLQLPNRFNSKTDFYKNKNSRPRMM